MRPPAASFERSAAAALPHRVAQHARTALRPMRVSGGVSGLPAEYSFRLYANVRQELDDVVGPDRLPNLDDREKLKCPSPRAKPKPPLRARTERVCIHDRASLCTPRYTWAVIKEVMRIRLVSPVLAPHYVSEEVEIGGYALQPHVGGNGEHAGAPVEAGEQRLWHAGTSCRSARRSSCTHTQCRSTQSCGTSPRSSTPRGKPSRHTGTKPEAVSTRAVRLRSVLWPLNSI